MDQKDLEKRSGTAGNLIKKNVTNILSGNHCQANCLGQWVL